MQSDRHPRPANRTLPGITSSRSAPRPAEDASERASTARLAWALGRTLRIASRLFAATGRSGEELHELELALGRASLPEEYADVARRIAAVELPAAVVSSSTSFLGALRKALIVVARGVSAESVAHELSVLESRYEADGTEDPQPLVVAAQHLAEAVAITRESSDVLHEGLRDVQGGIRRLVEEEDVAHSRIRATRERIAGASSLGELSAARTVLLTETAAIERVLKERRVALDALEEQSRNARRRAERLIAALADATTAASTDPLTGLGNRRSLSRRIGELARTKDACGVLVVDIDLFKRVNDAYGHGVGDRVLAHVAELLRGELRGDDHGFRYGGEEFVVVLSRCTLAHALTTAERVRTRVESTPIGVVGRSLSVTVSIGVSGWTPGTDFDAAVERADTALYDAKGAGRNRCLARAANA